MIQRYESDLLEENIVVYDLEIRKRPEDCKNGWGSYDEMGISVGCAYDYRSRMYRVFMQDNLQELIDRLNEPDTMIVGFNHVGFDNNLLRAHGPLKPDDKLNNYDMMLVSKDGAGVGDQEYVKGFSLDAHLSACGLPRKTANGAMVPIWWEQGKIGTIIDYCINDVLIEKALFELMYVRGSVASAYKREGYDIQIPMIETPF